MTGESVRYRGFSRRTNNGRSRNEDSAMGEIVIGAVCKIAENDGTT